MGFLCSIYAVEEMPLLKSVLGPMNAMLGSDMFRTNTNGEFLKQTFLVAWENKEVILQMHTLLSFALFVKQRQRVSATSFQSRTMIAAN